MKRVRVNVPYPKGYDPKKRRFAISSESINPEKHAERKVIPKTDEEKLRIRETVANNVLFKHLDEEQLNLVVDAMDSVEYGEGQVILKQGASLDQICMFVVDTEGAVEILYGDEVVATLRSGQAFGEIALMYGCPRTATVRTIGKCRLWVIDRNTFRCILMQESIRRRERYESVLANVPLFMDMLPYDRTKIADALEPHEYADGEVIICEGSNNTDKFFIIEQGRVVCKKSDEEGTQLVEAVQLGPGDYFGELALISNIPRQATVIALGRVKCLTIDRFYFDSLMGPCSEILNRNMTLYKTYNQLMGSPQHKRNFDDEVVNDEVIADLPDSRKELIKYIIEDEADYVSILTKLAWYYTKMSSHINELRMTKEKISNIFSNSIEILELHKLFYERMIKRAQTENPELGELYMILNLSAYEQFVQDYHKSVITLRTFEEQHKLFMEGCKKESGVALDVVLETVQLRVPRILMLLRRLVNLTPTHFSDKNTLAVAVRKIKSMDQTLKNIANFC